MSADRVKEVPSPIISIGATRGVIVTITRSRSSRLTRINEEFKNGDHIALSTEGFVKWADRPDVCGEHLLAHFMDIKRANPDFMNVAFWRIFPEYKEIPLSRFGLQTGSNDALSGTCDDIHAHVVFALEETWASGAIPRFVDPIEPVPAEKRRPREK